MKTNSKPKRKVCVYLTESTRVTLQKLSKRWRVSQDDAAEYVIVLAQKFLELREKLDLKMKGSLERL